MSEKKDTGAEVSSTPYLAPERQIKYTEEPQAQTALGGHAVPTPGHLRVLSPEGIGERANGGKAGANQPDWAEKPADAGKKIVAGGGTVGPDGEDAPVKGSGTEDAATVAEDAPKETKKRSTARKSTAKKKSAGDGAGTTSKEK